ncbi:MAG: hypothetical protein ACK4VI_09460 [Alphaproteobacteria bacterium]
MKKMKFLKFALALIFVVGLSACQQHHPKHPHAGGGFCPPGHAKKGNC